VKCSDYFGTKRHGLLKVKIVLAPKGAIKTLLKISGMISLPFFGVVCL
jgi:hypothetical protein